MEEEKFFWVIKRFSIESQEYYFNSIAMNEKELLEAVNVYSKLGPIQTHVYSYDKLGYILTWFFEACEQLHCEANDFQKFFSSLLKEDALSYDDEKI